jgi:hypothetical protein
MHDDEVRFGGDLTQFKKDVRDQSGGIRSGEPFIKEPLNFGLHKGFDDFVVRQNVTKESLHAGWGKKGAFAHIDRYGQYAGPRGFIRHSIEYLINITTGRKTDPFAVARGLRARGIDVGF